MPSQVIVTASHSRIILRSTVAIKSEEICSKFGPIREGSGSGPREGCWGTRDEVEGEEIKPEVASGAVVGDSCIETVIETPRSSVVAPSVMMLSLGEMIDVNSRVSVVDIGSWAQHLFVACNTKSERTDINVD